MSSVFHQLSQLVSGFHRDVGVPKARESASDADAWGGGAVSDASHPSGTRSQEQTTPPVDDGTVCRVPVTDDILDDYGAVLSKRGGQSLAAPRKRLRPGDGCSGDADGGGSASNDIATVGRTVSTCKTMFDCINLCQQDALRRMRGFVGAVPVGKSTVVQTHVNRCSGSAMGIQTAANVTHIQTQLQTEPWLATCVLDAIVALVASVVCCTPFATIVTVFTPLYPGVIMSPVSTESRGVQWLSEFTNYVVGQLDTQFLFVAHPVGPPALFAVAVFLVGCFDSDSTQTLFISTANTEADAVKTLLSREFASRVIDDNSNTASCVQAAATASTKATNHCKCPREKTTLKPEAEVSTNGSISTIAIKMGTASTIAFSTWSLNAAISASKTTDMKWTVSCPDKDEDEDEDGNVTAVTLTCKKRFL